jgi:hypothetical protein
MYLHLLTNVSTQVFSHEWIVNLRNNQQSESIETEYDISDCFQIVEIVYFNTYVHLREAPATTRVIAVNTNSLVLSLLSK